MRQQQQQQQLQFEEKTCWKFSKIQFLDVVDTWGRGARYSGVMQRSPPKDPDILASSRTVIPTKSSHPHSLIPTHLHLTRTNTKYTNTQFPNGKTESAAPSSVEVVDGLETGRSRRSRAGPSTQSHTHLLASQLIRGAAGNTYFIYLVCRKIQEISFSCINISVSFI